MHPNPSGYGDYSQLSMPIQQNAGWVPDQQITPLVLQQELPPPLVPGKVAGGPPQDIFQGAMEEKYRVDQRWVAFVVGKDGEALRKIMAQTGANIDVEPDLGCSIFTVRNAQSPQARLAIQQIEDKIKQCMNMPAVRSMLGDTLPVAMEMIS